MEKKQKTKNDKKINFRLTNDVYDKLILKSKSEQKRVSKLMREIVEFYTSL